MSKSERPGYATITIEVPLEVAEWLAVYGEHLGQIAALAAAKARLLSETAIEDRARKHEERRAELRNLGRVGYRLFRLYGGGKNVAKHQRLLRDIAVELRVDARTLERSIINFKRSVEKRLRERRGREIARLYWRGHSDGYIAARLKVHRNTVSNYLRDHKAELKAFAKAHPETANTLKGKKKGEVPGKSLGAFEAVPWEAIKQAGRRA